MDGGGKFPDSHIEEGELLLHLHDQFERWSQLPGRTASNEAFEEAIASQQCEAHFDLHQEAAGVLTSSVRISDDSDSKQLAYEATES